MQAVQKSLQLAKTALIEKHHRSVQTLIDCLNQEDIAPSFAKDAEQNEIIEQSNNMLGKDEEKVLQIDVIQSNYIPRTQEEIKEPAQHEPTQSSKIDQTHKEKKNLDQIQKQKKAILQQLRKIDEQIAIIKGEPAQDINSRRKEKEMEQEKVRKQAKDLVRQLKKEKKDLEQRKRKEHEKQLLLLKLQEEEVRQRRRQEQSRHKEQRRKAIQQRMEDQRKKRQQRKMMDKQSNKLLMQLKRQDQILKVKESIPAEITQVQQKKKVVQKRQDVNFREIEEHQRRYIIMKEQEKVSRRDRSESLSHHIPKYQKNTWIEKIEQEDFKKKQEEKLKQLQRKSQLQKRLKYGQLVKNIFLPKKKEESKVITEEVPKPQTPNVPLLPKISESDKRVTDTRSNNHFKQQNRPFATAHNYKKPPRAPKEPKEQKQEKEQAEPEIKQLDLQKEKQKKQRQLQLRRQTKQRLKKLENQSLDLMPQSKPKYQNYLNQVKQKRKDDLNWKEIIENGKLSKQQKYTEMLKKANNLENRAKQKEEFRKEGDEEAVNLYIGSIQAKLALLEKF